MLKPVLKEIGNWYFDLPRCLDLLNDWVARLEKTEARPFFLKEIKEFLKKPEIYIKKDQELFKIIEEEGVPLKEGAVELLDFLNKNNIKVALATSAKSDRTNAMIDDKKIREKFDYIVTGENVEKFSYSSRYADIFSVKKEARCHREYGNYGGKNMDLALGFALKEAENKLKTAQDKVTEAEEQIEEYTKATENGSYYYDYDLDNYKKRYETNYNLYNQLLSDWGIAESELNVSMSSAVSEFVLLSAPVNESVQDDRAADETSQEEKTSEESSSEEAIEESPSQESSTEESSQGGSNEESSSEESSAENGSSDESSSQESSEADSTKESSSEKESEEKESESETKKETEGQNENSQTVSETDKERMEKIKVLQQLKKAVQSSETSYSKAWKEYEEATNKAATQLKKLNAQIDSLRADLTEAQTTYELEKLEAETTYKKAVAQTNLAQSDYDAAIQKASDELEALEDEKTEAEENLKEFETLLGDGYFYTQNAGTVMMVGCESETNLQGNSMVVAYRNAEDISVSVSVSQEDINKLNVGDSAQVILDDYGTYEGVVSYLNPISTSDSRTNITYEVIVSLTGEDVSSLKENLTAEVIFQTGEQEE